VQRGAFLQVVEDATRSDRALRSTRRILSLTTQGEREERGGGREEGGGEGGGRGREEGGGEGGGRGGRREGAGEGSCRALPGYPLGREGNWSAEGTAAAYRLEALVRY
jgi:hypothetical protein